MLTAVLVLNVLILAVLVLMVVQHGAALKLEEPEPEPEDRIGPAIDGLVKDLDSRLETGAAEARDALEELREEISRIGAAVQALADRPELEPADPIEAIRAMLNESLEPVEARLSEIEAALSARSDDGLDDVIDRSLRKAGFDSITLLESPEAEGSSARVGVEARREGMTYKGHVVLVGGKLVDWDLRPSYPMFP